ncbi:Uncharacterised protein [uncultured archaeon]|nr:Uncharacterised protein [uncultured archaeon]
MKTNAAILYKPGTPFCIEELTISNIKPGQVLVEYGINFSS